MWRFVLVPGVAVFEVVGLPGVSRQDDRDVALAKSLRPQHKRRVPDAATGSEDARVVETARPVLTVSSSLLDGCVTVREGETASPCIGLSVP